MSAFEKLKAARLAKQPSSPKMGTDTYHSTLDVLIFL